MNTTAPPAIAASGDRLARAAVAASATLFAISSALLLVSIASPEPVLRLTGPSPFLAIEVDRLAALLLVLVSGVATVAQGQARRFLRGEPRQREFALLGLALTLATMGLVSAATLVTLGCAWILTGALTAQLIALRPSGRRSGPSRPATLLVGDLALIVAVGATTAVAGNVAIGGSAGTSDLTRAAAELGPWLGPVALLIVAAVVARCAQLPLGAWLPGSVDAPTPVSALLHAGVVNGGGVLLLRASPVLDAWPVSWAVLVAIATATAFVATLVMSVATDVKGGLVRSTSAQMGFMLVTVAAGLPAAAVAHLTAHGMFKAGLFLGAGDAVHRAAARRSLAQADPARRGAATLVCAAAVAGLAVVAATLAVEAGGLGAPLSASKVALLGFASVTGAVVLHGWLRHATTVAASVRAAATVAASCGAYVVGMALLTSFLAPSVVAPVGLGALAFAPIAGAAAAVWLAQRPSTLPTSVRSSLYVAAVNGTHPVAGTRASLPLPLPVPVRRSSWPRSPAPAAVGARRTSPPSMSPQPVPDAEVAA